MASFNGIAWGVSPKPRSIREPHRPSAEFGRRAVELAKTADKSKQDILRATGHAGRSTMVRLLRGDGSMLFAIAVKKALKGWGLDVSQLPPIEEDAPAGGAEEEWLQEWVELGKELHRLANEDRFEVEVARIRKVIEAHELVAEGTRDPRDDE